jgi:hypothetical protein
MMPQITFFYRAANHGVCDQQASALASIRLIVCYSRGRPFSVVADSIFVSSFGGTSFRELSDSLIDIPLLRNLELSPQSRHHSDNFYSCCCQC